MKFKNKDFYDLFLETLFCINSCLQKIIQTVFIALLC